MTAVKAMKPLRLPALVAAALAGLLWAGAVQAQIWAYVDERGVAHFSAEKLDPRYEIFHRGGGVLEAGVGISPPPATAATAANAVTAAPAPEAPWQPLAEPPSASPAQSRLMGYLENSPRYKAVQQLLKDAAHTHGLDHELLQALIAAESGFDAQAVSPKGAVGLMQLMVATASRYGVRADRHGGIAQKLTDPQTNLRAGSRYLRDLIALFPGRLDLAVAAYNAGEGAVQRAGNKVPNYPETQNYVKTVLQLYAFLKPPVLAKPSEPVAVPVAMPAAPPKRVRMELMGGATGRGNMLPDAGPLPLLRPISSSPGP
jgi:hypothetical protein